MVLGGGQTEGFGNARGAGYIPAPSCVVKEFSSLHLYIHRFKLRIYEFVVACRIQKGVVNLFEAGAINCMWPDVGSGHWTRLLWKSSKHSQLCCLPAPQVALKAC